MATDHGFCPLHKIGYNRDMDATCPQCVIAGHLPPDQLDYDTKSQSPLSASGERLDRRTLQAVK
jgi:hypothetical protein